MKNEANTMVTLDVLSKLKEQVKPTRNNYRKYHKLPMYRGNVKQKKRLNATKVSYIGTMGTGRCFSMR